MRLEDKAQAVLDACESKGWMLTGAESCTGGMVMAALTAVIGCSRVVDRGFVTYSNDAKTEMLGVPAEAIALHGAVSEQVARAMALGALAHSRAQAAFAITGIAGPGGGSADKPVGLVHLAAATADGHVLHRREIFEGDRDAVRLQAARTALAMVLELATP